MGPGAVLAVFIVSLLCRGSMAATYIVGDDLGWTLPSAANANFNYTAWAENQTFVVGDVLQFMHASNVHNVQPLPSKESFDACDLSAAAVPALKRGINVVTLVAEGTKWYVCGVGNHCSLGMKVKIDVRPAVAAPTYNIQGVGPSDPSIFLNTNAPSDRVEGSKQVGAPTGTPANAPETGAASSLAINSVSVVPLVAVVLSLFL